MPKFSPQELAEVRRKTEELEARQADLAGEGPSRSKRRRSASSKGKRRGKKTGSSSTPWGQKLVAPLLLIITVVVSWLVLVLSQS